MENQSDVQNHLVEIQFDDHDLLVNSDNENDDMLGYESEKEYGKPSGIKIKVTFDALNKKKGDKESRDKLWDEITRYFDVDLTVRMSVMHRLEEWVEFVNYTTTDAYKKEADDKIKEGTLNLDDGTNAMTIVFGKEKGGYARGVGSGVTYKRYFHLPRSRQATDERIELLQTKLDNERRKRQQKDVLVKKLSIEMTEKDVLVKKLSNEMTETKRMLSQLMNQLATQGVDETQSSVVVRDKDARIQKKSNGLVTSEKASKCKRWHLKKPNIVALSTVYKSDGKQMLHNQALPNDCYKVSIDSSLVDAACLPDVGNNALKIVKDSVGGFFTWPKKQVVLDEEVILPTTIQKISDYNFAPKLQSKRKNYVSHETMKRQAKIGQSHKSLNYGS
uniref:DUF8039 domain-containing protein n=1 Tax=Tanacetum cinerariifolium TaxID=118510 RepID=A0A699IGV8_TANCI|nr:hypothetical protein [Tanacetum cinerariifolium]